MDVQTWRPGFGRQVFIDANGGYDQPCVVHDVVSGKTFEGRRTYSDLTQNFEYIWTVQHLTAPISDHDTLHRLNNHPDAIQGLIQWKNDVNVMYDNTTPSTQWQRWRAL